MFFLLKKCVLLVFATGINRSVYILSLFPGFMGYATFFEEAHHFGAYDDPIKPIHQHGR